jgi:GNAT superfamily N-acetyltransferase
MSFLVRKATPGDIPAIHDLVRELAIYERAENEFVATIEDYTKNFKDGTFDAIVALSDEKVIGMAFFYMAYSTWKGRMMYLEDFVVYEEYRRSGVGQQIFDAFLEEARNKGCVLAKWQVLDWNEPAIAFYRKNQATIEQEWYNGKIYF